METKLAAARAELASFPMAQQTFGGVQGPLGQSAAAAVGQVERLLQSLECTGPEQLAALETIRRLMQKGGSDFQPRASSSDGGAAENAKGQGGKEAGAALDEKGQGGAGTGASSGPQMDVDSGEVAASGAGQ